MGGRGSGSRMGSSSGAGKTVTVTGPSSPSPRQDAERLQLNSIFNSQESRFEKSINELGKGGLNTIAKTIGANVNGSMSADQMRRAIIDRRRSILSNIDGNSISVSKLKRLMRGI